MQEQDFIYDIGIVGAGPGGSTLARLAAQSGFSVLLIDGQRAECSKPCGGLLAPDAQKALAHFDLTLPKSVLVDPQIFSVRTIDVPGGLLRYYPRHYLNVDRYAFDRWLLSLLPETVNVVSARCSNALRRADGLFELQTAPQQSQPLLCRRLVGADGAKSLIRRLFFPAAKGREVQHYVAIQQWFAAESAGEPFYSCIFDPETSESCSWSIFKDGYFIFGGCFAPRDCRAMFELQKQRLQKLGFSFGTPLKTEACLALRPRRPRDFCCGKNGVYLLGEAAGFISPSSFEGISNAILSAAALAEALEQHRSAQEEAALARAYFRGTRKLRLKLLGKTLKRLFMYTPALRRAVMKSGVASIRVRLQPPG